MYQEEQNASVQQPLAEYNKMVKELLVHQARHNEIKNSLKDCQSRIKDIEGGIGDMEWEYEVKLQQM